MEDDPGFDLVFDERDGIIHAFVTGPHDSYELARDYYTRIYEKAKFTGHKKVLVEEDFPNQISMSDMFKSAVFVQKVFVPPFQIALVDRSVNDKELNEFGELVAQNRGIHGKIFNRIEDAEEWLRGNSQYG